MTAGAPRKNFKREDESIWGPICFELGRKRMTISNIAGKFRVPYSSLAQNEPAMEYVRAGWAEHDENVLTLLLEQANDKPGLYDDPAERAQVRNLKAQAVKTLHASITAIIPPAPQEIERVRRLTDEQLEEELAKFTHQQKTKSGA